jgi:oligopeptide/dipeptide ABC transporter ATP-binding protein
VMYAGHIVEIGPASRIISEPRHPYTRALLASVPRLDLVQSRLPTISGQPPDPGRWPAGCRFHPRCPIARPSCATEPPSLLSTPGDVRVRCPWWNDPSPAAPAS